MVRTLIGITLNSMLLTLHTCSMTQKNKTEAANCAEKELWTQAADNIVDGVKVCLDALLHRERESRNIGMFIEGMEVAGVIDEGYQTNSEKQLIKCSDEAFEAYWILERALPEMVGQLNEVTGEFPLTRMMPLSGILLEYSCSSQPPP